MKINEAPPEIYEKIRLRYDFSFFFMLAGERNSYVLYIKNLYFLCIRFLLCYLILEAKFSVYLYIFKAYRYDN